MQNPRGRVVMLVASVVATLVTVGWAVHFAHVAATDDVRWAEYLEKDSYEGAGLIEDLTFFVLIPGILAAAFALVKWRKRVKWNWLKVYLALWILACVYFAGEEVSWGQWWFGWETPEVFEQINYQGETNIHNTTSWLNQKPRAAVETFIMVAGLLVPVGLVALRKKVGRVDERLRWILAPSMCWAAAAYFLVVRTASWVSVHPLWDKMDESELRELTIAWFLTLYLMSYAIRLGFEKEPAKPDLQEA